MVNYISTRGGGKSQSFTDVLLSGMATDGGLYMPEKWPALESALLAGKSYAEAALHIIRPFTGGCIRDADLEKIAKESYAFGVFDDLDIASLHQISDNRWLLELFHGPTLSFKDYALQLLGRLFDHVLAEKNQRVTIVGATSGDTGSAAIEACRNCPNIKIFILHPHGRTSDVQRRQMTTIDSENVHNIAIEGTFDDCQALVKALFADGALRDELNLSAVNSINWARIMAQIVYYAVTAAALGGAGKRVSFAVPTGNFGNVFSAWAARHMGMPIGDLVIASNRNDILTRFFESGRMECANVMASLSPSMDIQVSSNFERYLFELLGHDSAALKKLMDDFSCKRSFSLDDASMARARRDFLARRCTDEQTLETMKKFYRDTGILVDPHTAVGLHAASGLDNNMPTVIVSTAHPAKFPEAVERATGVKPPVPPQLAAVLGKKEHFTILANDLGRVREFVRGNAGY